MGREVPQGLLRTGDDRGWKEDAVPHALYVPRSISIPLRPMVKEELDRMDQAGVISRVNKPTPWCAGIVVVPKKTGSVRISSHLTKVF